MSVEYSEFKGRPIIVLSAGESDNPFSKFQFGPAKAQLIVDNFEAIKKFAAKHLTKDEKPAVKKGKKKDK